MGHHRRLLVVAPIVALLAGASSPAAAFSYSLAPTRIIVNGDVLRLQGELDLAGERPRLTGSLSGPRLDLRPWQGGTGTPARPERRGEPGSGDPPSDRIFSPEPLPFDLLRSYDLAVALSLERVVLEGADLVDLRAEAALGAGRLRLSPLAISLGAGRIDGTVTLDAADGERPALSLELSGRDLESAELLAVAGQPPVLDAPAEFRASLRASGVSLAELAGSLTGEVTALLDQGRFETAVLGAARDEARLLIETLQRGRVGRSSRLNCAAFDLAAERGVVTPELAVLDTELATLAVEGSIDLGRERLDLDLLPRTKVAGFNVAAPFFVTGTLAAPDVGVDRGGAARQLAGLLGSLAAPPAVRRDLEALGGANGCLSLEDQPAAEAEQPLPVPDDPRDALGDLLDRGVRGLFDR